MTTQCPKCKAEIPDESKFCLECGLQMDSMDKMPAPPTQTLEVPKEELTTGSTFAERYQIIEELGTGGMGKVYRALDKRLNEEVALKLIKPEIASDKKTLERFQNELKLARKISHRNVGRMYELLEDKGTSYITMEYVSGQDLKSLVRQTGQLAMPTALSVVKQICEGLSEAHQLGIIHRDLKPSNILIDKDGNARIMDFGIARSLKGKGITGSGVMIGTPEYMSPEQVEGKDVDRRSDIYSLGIILFEMVTGRVPFEGDTPFAIGMKHKGEMPQNPKELNAQIPDDLNRLILRCLEKEKAKRYQNCDEFNFALEQIATGIPAAERVVPRKKPLTSKEITVSFSLKKLFVPIVAVLAVLVTVLIILNPFSRDKTIPVPKDRPSIAVLPFENNTGDETQDQLRDSLSDQLTADLYQSKYLHVLSAPHVYGILKRLDLLQAEKFSFEDLKSISRQGGVNHLLTGSYTEDNDTFMITVTINRSDPVQDAPSFTVDGPRTGNIGTFVDEITKRIKAELELTQTQIESDIDREVARITSSSPEALQLYSQARRKQFDADYPGAIKLYKKIIAIDPEFAMAIRGMAVSYWNMYAYSKKSLDLLEQALDLGERLSYRERLQIKGDLNSASGRQDEAIAAFTELLELHPDDSLAHYSLGLAYRRKGETDKEIESLKRAVQYRSEFPGTYRRLASIYRQQGLNDKADETIQLYVDNFGDHPSIHQASADRSMRTGDYDLALSDINKALALNPINPFVILKKGDIHFYRLELGEAEEEYQKLLREEEVAYYSFGLTRLINLYSFQGKFEASKVKVKEGIERAQEAGEIRWMPNWLISSAYLELSLGNFEQALRELDRALDLASEHNLWNDQSYCLCLKGLVYLRMKSINMAQETAGRLMQFVKQNEISDTSYLDFLLGSIELERGNYSQAISIFEKALSNNEYNILYSYAAAQAYYGERSLEKAQKECEKILSYIYSGYRIGYPGYSDLYSKLYYVQGLIFEQKGWKDKAIENYEKFLDLWKDADPGIVEVEDARDRLAGLK